MLSQNIFSRMLSVKTKPLWSVFGLSLAAAVFTAVYKVMDNITVNKFVVAEDAITAVSAYLIFAGWIAVISSLGFTLLCGQKLVDPDFQTLKILKGHVAFWAFVAGSIAAGGTFFNLWANTYVDPGTCITLGNMLIVFTATYELIKKEIRIKEVILPIFLVVGGGIMASYSGSLEITLISLILMGVVSNSLYALSEVAEQKGVRQTDGVNFFFWRCLWLAVGGTSVVPIVALLRGKLPLLLETITKAVSYTPWFVMTMFFVFLGIGLKLTAKKKGAISVVLMILSGQVLIGYLFTFLGNAVIPGLFPDFPYEVSIWTVRSVGALLLIVGILHLRRVA